MHQLVRGSLNEAPCAVRRCAAIVCIPARNEADRIGRCLAALAVQRDRNGAPVVPGSFAVLLLVNNSTDATAQAARSMALQVPYPLEVLEITLESGATAGGARRRAMEEAAARLRAGERNGVLLTTDADSAVSPSWYAENMRHLEEGADCVAGYIDAEAPEIVSLGAAFLERGRLEDMYLRLVAEIYALCDPRPHDPWPNHRVSSGASIAVTVAAYDAVGGMPDRALGEDGAFTAILEEKGFRVRHPLDVCVLTSCRLNGRAAGGAADTMRHRRDLPNAPCDDELEPALATLRRAVMRGLLRQASEKRKLGPAMERLYGEDWRPNCAASTFADAWKEMQIRHPKLRRGPPLRPSNLPRQIAVAKFILRHLRLKAQTSIARGDRCLHAKSSFLVDA
jgi:Glycosyl transferase family 2